MDYALVEDRQEIWDGILNRPLAVHQGTFEDLASTVSYGSVAHVLCIEELPFRQSTAPRQQSARHRPLNLVGVTGRKGREAGCRCHRSTRPLRVGNSHLESVVRLAALADRGDAPYWHQCVACRGSGAEAGGLLRQRCSFAPKAFGLIKPLASRLAVP